MYVTLRQKLVTFFRQNNCHPADDHADEALSRIARRDDVDEIRNVSAFAYGVARRMKLDIYEKAKREVSLDDGLDVAGTFPPVSSASSGCNFIWIRCGKGELNQSFPRLLLNSESDRHHKIDYVGNAKTTSCLCMCQNSRVSEDL